MKLKKMRQFLTPFWQQRQKIMKNKQFIKGTSFISLSALFFASYGIWSKFMSHSFGEFNQAWTRALIVLCLLIPFGLLTKKFKKIA